MLVLKRRSVVMEDLDLENQTDCVLKIVGQESYLLGNYPLLPYTEAPFDGRKELLQETLFPFSISLLAYYHECRALIGYATHYLFCDR